MIQPKVLEGRPGAFNQLGLRSDTYILAHSRKQIEWLDLIIIRAVRKTDGPSTRLVQPTHNDNLHHRISSADSTEGPEVREDQATVGQVESAVGARWHE